MGEGEKNDFPEKYTPLMGRSNIHARFQKKLNFTLKMVSKEVRPEDITSLIIVLRSLEVLVVPKVLEEYYFQSKNL